MAIQRTYRQVARITALHDVDPARARRLARRLHPHPAIVSLSALIQASDLVLEAASVRLAGDVVRRALRAGRNVLAMSVGGLLGDRRWQAAARRSRGRVYLPSGALAGLDGVKALSVGRIRRLVLTTTKPPAALQSAPYVQRKRLDLSRLRRATVLFEGPPPAVIRGFPQNTNVAAALSLAAGPQGADRARIRVVADPTARRNIHELEVEGDCGRITCRIESRPSANPRTSEIAVRSAIATLGRIFDPVGIGT